MKQHHIVYAVLFAASAALIYFLPALGVVPFVVAFAVGTIAVFGVQSQMLQFLECSQKLATKAALQVLETLIDPNQEDGRASLPSFVRAGRRSQDLKDLYNSAQFQNLCRVIRMLGPVPCYPAVLLLEKSSEL